MVKEVCKHENEEVPTNYVESMSYKSIVETLVTYLQSRRYLIVIDDVWNIQFWQEIKIALPGGMCGSRVLVTTREEDVAPFQYGFVFALHILIHGEECSGKMSRLATGYCGLGQFDVFQEVNSRMEEKPEVVVENYLMKLISRSLLQVTRRNASGRPKAFKMHDLLREFALSISKEEKFVAVYDGRKGVEDNGIHRCSIMVKDKETKPAGNGVSQLRFLLNFFADENSKSSFNKMPSGFKLLRVLDLEDAPIHELPSSIVNLFNLRYLNLTKTQVKVIPKSIGKLLNLQILLLKFTKIQEFPQQIMKLQNLRHLCASYYILDDIDVECYKNIHVPSNNCMIKSLQVLSDVRAKDGLVKQLKGMTQLRRLSLDKLVEPDEKDLCFAIGKMEHLQNLTLSSSHKSHLKIDALGSAPPYLDKLSLVGKLAKVPYWFNTLQNLTFLSLQFSQLLEDVVSRLQALPNLSYPRLSDNAFQGERLCFVDGCKELRRMPYGSELDRPHLEKVIVYDVSMELVESLCRKGDDYHLRTRPPYITLTRPDDHESNSKWICKVHN
ncbi:NB-ARC domain-containing protein [Corchorus olitorius]|uniref:NB-ARC domain-containing protein n=1 Tax=Corchorus olitorius TaxID=93759 RepID=A0A1R3I2Z5_9ROSI|nr:NB-ARC domain-containing protein [Corchorus olitorius]